MCLAPDAAAAATWLQGRCRAGDALLLKASRGVRIETVLTHWQKES
jgi:UDP-N-acetylmuramyl pentapeptide synthase